jgi:Tol biopolymer transport system component
VALTDGYAAWFAASYGKPSNPGGGSNIPKWSRDSLLLYNRRLPGSLPPWKYNVGRTDTNHFNRDFVPGQARGGAELWIVDPGTRRHRRVTRPGEGGWDLRGEWSPDGRRILHCRARVGGNPELWVVDRDGRGARRLSDGIDGHGCEHPRWIPTFTGPPH